MKKLFIILASTRRERLGSLIANWVTKEASKHQGYQYELVDLVDYPLPALDSDQSPVQGKTAAELVKAWAEKMAEADGYIFVSPEYNHGYSGVLKNALDTLRDEWQWKPAGIVGYGGIAGGARSMEQLRLVLIELKMRPTYASVVIPLAWEAFDDKGQPKHKGMESNLAAIIEELKMLSR